MKFREIVKWAVVAHLVTLVMFIYTLRMMPSSPDNVLANFAKVMITQFYPLSAIVPVLSIYSICVRRWQPVLGGLVGNIVFFPSIPVLVLIFTVVVGLPIDAWRAGWHVAAIALAIAYCLLAFVLARKWMKRRRSQPATPPYSEPAARPPQR